MTIGILDSDPLLLDLLSTALYLVDIDVRTFCSSDDLFRYLQDGQLDCLIVNLRLSDELTAFTLLRGMVVFDIKLGMMSTQPPDIIFAEAPDLRTLPLLSLPFKLRSLYLYITVLSGKAVKLKDAPVH